jgi:hypothetical protein
MGSVNLATGRPHGRFYIPAEPPAATLARERRTRVAPFSDATERAWMKWQADKPKKEIFTQADRDHALRHLTNSTAPLLEFSQVEKDYDARLRYRFRERNEIQGGQLYFKATYEFGARAVLTESNSYAIHTLGHRWAGHRGPQKVLQYLRQFYHPISLIDCEWIKANCRVCSITDLTGADSESTSSQESEVGETATPAPEPRKTIIESPDVRQGLDSSQYFCNRRQMTASPTPPPQPTFIRNKKPRPRNRGFQSRFHPKTLPRLCSSSFSASAETPSRNLRFTRKQTILPPRARRSMTSLSNNTQSGVLGMRRR